METFDVVAPPTRERRKLSARCKLAEIEEEFGIGAYLYFDFLRFLILLDLVVFLIRSGGFLFCFNFSKIAHLSQCAGIGCRTLWTTPRLRTGWTCSL